jgi:hypothetical protein
LIQWCLLFFSWGNKMIQEILKKYLNENTLPNENGEIIIRLTETKENEKKLCVYLYNKGYPDYFLLNKVSMSKKEHSITLRFDRQDRDEFYLNTFLSVMMARRQPNRIIAPGNEGLILQQNKYSTRVYRKFFASLTQAQTVIYPNQITFYSNKNLFDFPHTEYKFEAVKKFLQDKINSELLKSSISIKEEHGQIKLEVIDERINNPIAIQSIVKDRLGIKRIMECEEQTETMQTMPKDLDEGSSKHERETSLENNDLIKFRRC